MGIADSLSYVVHGTADDVVYRLGLGIMGSFLKPFATYAVRGESDRRTARIVNECIAFVHGSGLDVAIRQFGFNVDADEFRETFLAWCDYQRRLEHRPSA